ncbi:MAG TPA: hypothetical protein VFG86_04100 [Chloroflexota bacterium]|jgi:hypothetical protein|nr:hypothetical protein [Chloroflexota bacterium]
MAHRFAVAQLRSVMLRQRQKRDETPVGIECPAARLKHGHEIVVESKAREPLADVLLIERLELQPVVRRASDRAGNVPTVRWTDKQAARHAQQRLAGFRLELLPHGVSALHQRHILRRLEVGLANGAAGAVG